MSAIDVLHAVTAAMAVLGGLLALVRMGLGPTLLDRVVANDVLAAVAIDLVAVMVVWWRRSDLGVLLVVLALTSFLASVVVARHAEREDSASRRILTPAQAAQQREERERAARLAQEAEHEEGARWALEAGSGTPGDPDAEEGGVDADEAGPARHEGEERA